ncbi:hypothetical protein UW618_02270, partial [Streptococcus agalactiae]
KVDDLSNSSTDTTKLQSDVDSLTKKVADDQKSLETAKQSLDTVRLLRWSQLRLMPLLLK